MDLQPFIRKVNYYETDQMGIIHHSNYIRYFEEARVDFMEQIGYGYEKSAQLGVDFAVLEVQCKYKSMIHFGDMIEIYLTVTEFDPVKLTVEYKIIDNKTKELRTEGISKHCFYDTKNQRLVSLKKKLPELYSLINEIYQNNTL